MDLEASSAIAGENRGRRVKRECQSIGGAGVPQSATIWVDHTHMGRRASGIERITSELFSVNALLPFKSKAYVAGTGRFGVVAAQMFGLPLAAIRNPNDVFVFPGFPPSPYFSTVPGRSLLYVHDLFLLTRKEQLNRAGKYYMSPLFRLAIRSFRNFLTNSEDTAKKLKEYCDPSARVMPYRPRIRNLFELSVDNRNSLPGRPDTLKVVTLGTIEPRKNFIAAADICEEISRQVGCAVELHIVGRNGWGNDGKALSARSNVILHGFLSDLEAGKVLSAADLYLCTSHEEGLCLPLLEAQYGGLAVVAPDAPVFREVLDSSGIFIEPGEPQRSAALIVQSLGRADWRRSYSEASLANIERWNRQAEMDRHDVMGFFDRLTSNAPWAPQVSHTVQHATDHR
jgi:glycosyltransferase involved in cell wall biosynthesis